MKKIYPNFILLFFWGLLGANTASAQLSATVTSYESRCAATGSVKIAAKGGSGSYQYKTEGPVNSNYTNLDSITGLSSGTYTVIVNDIVTNEVYRKTGVVVGGSYSDPRFTLNHVDVSCENGSNGSIMVENLQNGRYPFTYSIVAPSPMGVGVSNTTGVFNNLKAGYYSIMLTDSCGGIQTRTVTVNNYTWNIDSYNFTKVSCDNATGYITVKDSKGNDSKYTAIPGFSYGVVFPSGDTTWSADGNFSITVTGVNSIEVFAKDGCGKIKKVSLSAFLVPSLDADINVSNRLCNTFTASVTGIKNFFGSQFSLYNSAGVKIADNTSGVFANIPFGKYCIKAHDGCSDSTITRCFEVLSHIASVGSNVTITNKTCLSFSATVTGQQNLTYPVYCLINSSNDTLSCNSSGIFNNISYGDYCIAIKDGCLDTTILRCFSTRRPVPKVDPTIVPAYITCSNFGIDVDGDSLTNPTYCLYDSHNNLVGACNSTGIFDSIPFGSYCVTIHDACLDTTITRCFNAGPPTVANDINIAISDKNCTSFTATATTSNLTGVQFCLYKKSDSSLILCNSIGVFNGLPFGDYYIKAKNSCPDTTMVNSFSVVRTIPTVNSSVNIYNRSCSAFSAEITNQQNLITPSYCVINTNTNDTLECNATGKFSNLPYGSYLVYILSGCNDTLRIPFSSSSSLLDLNITAAKSCYYGYSKFNISLNTGTLPVNIKIYTPADDLFTSRDFNVNAFSIDSIPELPSGFSYKIIGTDACGKKDTLHIAPIIGYLQHTTSVTAKCPGSVWPNGSGDVKATITTNLPSVSVKIIKKDGAVLSPELSPSSVSGSDYSFNDLGPATYVIRYKANDGCNVSLYDTVILQPYKFPNLSRSSAYQCDNNGFSVGATVSNGVGPFTYEIIGSTPEFPSLIGSPQSDPVFNINNGTTYSLVRLRALDACRNATLGDASVLPLADNGIRSTLNCLQSPATLSVDTIYNSTYSWAFKPKAGVDSTVLGNEINYYIPDVMPSDTGIYICDIKVYNGCISRTYYFHLDGSCYYALPMEIENFSGRFIGEKTLLNWTVNNPKELREIIIERKNKGNIFNEIGKINLSFSPAVSFNKFTDEHPDKQNFYRIKLVKNNNTAIYSDIILVQRQINRAVSIYPNPATNILNIEFLQPNGHNYKITLSNTLNQTIREFSFNPRNGAKFQIKRSKEITNGLYILRFRDENTYEEFSQQVIFTSNK